MRNECRVSGDFFDKECVEKKGILDKDFGLIIEELNSLKMDLKAALRSIHLKPVVIDEKMQLIEQLHTYPFIQRNNRIPVTSSFPYIMSDNLYSWDQHEVYLQKTNVCIQKSLLWQLMFWHDHACTRSLDLSESIRLPTSENYKKVWFSRHTHKNEVTDSLPEHYFHMSIKLENTEI